MTLPAFAAAAAFHTAPVTARQLSHAALRGAFYRAMPPNARIDIYVRLQGRHDDQIDAYAAAVMSPGSPYYAQYLTPEQFGAYFGADPSRYARAVAALRSRGFVIDDLPENRTDIAAHASAAQVEAFFGTPLEFRVDRGRVYYANRYDPVVPRELGIDAVSGLDDYVEKHPMLGRPDTKINGSFSWGPPDFAAAYDLNPLYAEGLDGKGVTIANATCGAALQSDLTLFESTFSLPPAQLVSTPQPRGSALTPSCGRSGYGNGESSLDVDAATGIAREATFHQVVAHGPSNHDFDLTYSYIVNKLAHTVHVVTTSWGTCERDMQGTPSLNIDEKLYAQAAMEGQHWFAAAGDTGTDDCQDGGTAVSVDFPGSSPYVTDVGGTDVAARIVRGRVVAWRGETAWQLSVSGDGATGGGVSILYAKPAYQRNRTPNDGKRDVPDVALLSDGRDDGTWVAQGGVMQAGWGGTSEAAPMWAGLLAIIEQRHRGGLIADPHARLYALASSARYHDLFHDVTRGNNSFVDHYGSFPGYRAGPGFDLCTGWGSFIGSALAHAY
jgi:subtilase family serine protease